MDSRQTIAFAGVMICLCLILWRNFEFETPYASASTAELVEPLGETREPSFELTGTNFPEPVNEAPQIIPRAESHDLLCILKKVRSSVPLSGDLQVQIFQSETAENKEYVSWIKSETCPTGFYSILHFDGEGSVTREIDCRKASPTELAAMSGSQSEIKDAEDDEDHFSLAISGPDFFVLRCPSGQLVLTRDGKFLKDADGSATNDDGCTLQNRSGTPFQVSNVDDIGCSADGNCVALMTPSETGLIGLNSINNFSFYATGISAPSVSPSEIESPKSKVFSNALEDVRDHARGLTSVVWGDRDTIRLNEIECD